MLANTLAGKLIFFKEEVLKKVTYIIDSLIIVLVIAVYLICISPYFYKDNFPQKLIDAIEEGDMEYLENQFSDDAKICIIYGEYENRYRAGYVIGLLEERLPVHIVNIKYLNMEEVYEVVYYDDESEVERIVYVTYATNRWNLFQTKITGMSVEFIDE